MKTLVLLGKTMSGKSSVENIFVRKGYIPIVEYSTRPIRDGEKDGVAYHFVTDECFDKMLGENLFAEFLLVNTVHGLWKYGALRKDFEDNGRVIVMGPRQFMQLVESGVEVNSVLIDIPDEEVYARVGIMRMDSIEEVTRRLETDNPAYEQIRQYVSMVVDGRLPLDEIVHEIETGLPQ